MQKKDKQKVFGGEWSQEQLEEFLCENDTKVRLRVSLPSFVLTVT